MWPWGHAAVGYLLYSVWRRSAGTRPTSPAVLALGLGTVFPDLIDKPLAWTFGVLPTGRTLAHSLLITGGVLLLVSAASSTRDRRQLVLPFAVGTVTHSLADVGPAALTGDLSGATYLLWPALPSPAYPAEQSFLAHLAAFTLDPYTAVQFALAGLAGLVWLADGRPGAGVFRVWLRRLLAWCSPGGDE